MTEWKLVWSFETSAEQPKPRCGHSCTAVDEEKRVLVAFGASKPVFGPRIAVYGDVWALSFRHHCWRKLIVTPEQEAMVARFHHGAVTLVPLKSAFEALMIFGGLNSAGVVQGDSWYLEGGKGSPALFEWKKIDTEISPSARFGHTMTSLANPPSNRSECVLFGGRNSDGDIMNDLWIFSAKRQPWKWKKIHDVPGQAPSPRSFHCACLDPSGKKLLVCGGLGKSGPVTDFLFALDMERFCWVQVAVDPAPPRFGHSACMNRLGVIIYGGLDRVENAVDLPHPQTLIFTGTPTRCSLKTAAEVGMKGVEPGQGRAGSTRSFFGHVCLSDGTLVVMGGWKPVLKACTNSVWGFAIDQPAEDVSATVDDSAPAKHKVSLSGNAFLDAFDVRTDVRCAKVSALSESLKPVSRERGVDAFVDSILEKLLGEQEEGEYFVLSCEEIERLSELSLKIIRGEPNVLRLSAPIKVFGDIHGQYSDLLRAFKTHGAPFRYPGYRCDLKGFLYLFLGDYVDRGPCSLEVICLLLALKVKHPRQVLLLRGNHECTETHRRFGFQSECAQRCKDEDASRVWFALACSMMSLPFAAVIDDKIGCVHGGPGPHFSCLEDLTQSERGREIAESSKAVQEAMWGDPTDNDSVNGFHENPMRGPTCWKFGPDRAAEFCRKSGLELLIRAHQPVLGGVEYFAGGHVITVFTAVDYGGLRNKGAFLEIDRDLQVEPVILSSLAESEYRPSTPLRRKPKGSQDGPSTDD